ncbi:class II aldolase/adducin family protein [Nonomuraea angiospora]|uniref:class II aldolase/adducin family protein n=1 Tax=Nonomuraea angiospora TaxID=46172 RepID=UPI0029BE1BAB|nr:class II aldolase/adducin family protein [Nonomuraea angiospora]MDX3100916.1 class II aldolase/adducin family protein [Nonomuraea angiospora]
MNDVPALRRQLVEAGGSIHRRRLTHGRTGNISVRTKSGYLVTPTGCSLGELHIDDLSVLDTEGHHSGGPPPTKETFLHLAILRERPDLSAVVHTHSVASAAVSCLDGLDEAAALPPLTAYFTMRVGTVPLLPFAIPGDTSLGPAISQQARAHTAMLLRNHGPVVAGTDLASALDALEELEHAAELFLRLAPFGDRVRTVMTEEKR